MRRAKRFRISDIQTFKDRIDVFSPSKVPEGEAIELSIFCSYRLNLARWGRVHYRLLSFDFIPKENAPGASWSVKDEKSRGHLQKW